MPYLHASRTPKPSHDESTGISCMHHWPFFKDATISLQSQAVISIAIVNKIHDDIQLSTFLHWLLFVQKIFSWAPFCIGCFLAATKQPYKWYFPSVRLSVRLYVCPSVTLFLLCSHHRIIMKFSGVITSDRSDVHAKGQGQRSKVKVTEVTTQLNRFRTVTPVWIHVWWWNDAYSLIMPRRGALLFFKVICQISRSRGSKNCRIWPKLGVSGL